MVMQKNASAKPAWATDTAGGRNHFTVNPPRRPWTITVVNAPIASQRTARRRSTVTVQMANTMVNKPTAEAIKR